MISLRVDRHFAETDPTGGDDRLFREHVLAGLSQCQKAIPARWLYDDAGSRLFETITTLPEYYLSRTETAILTAHSADLARLVPPGHAVVEFGSGSSVKTPILLDAVSPAAYVPIDISGQMLRRSAGRLAAQFPGLPVVPLEADFTHATVLPRQLDSLSTLGFFPGSTIGNFEPPAAVDQLRSMRATLGDDSLLLLGLDRIKDERVLLTAYDDVQGVTAAFNLNLITRINRELAGTLTPTDFVHSARWNAELSRIEMHLLATRAIVFRVAGVSFAMRAGETIHTENSHKYDPGAGAMMLLAGGWTPVARWSDPARYFDVVLATASGSERGP